MAGFSDGGESISINITPMMDIFSILITFLLMSYSTDPVIVEPEKGLVVPNSNTISGMDEIPLITVSQEEIRVNEKAVASVINGEVPESERAQGAVQALFDALDKVKTANDEVQKSLGKKPKLGSLTMQMDKELTFKLTKRVMLSAQQASFVKFKLMTVRNAGI